MVTGGAGFIGSAVLRRILSRTEHDVVNVDKLTYAANVESIGDFSGSPRYRFEQVDVCNASALAHVFNTHRPNGVMHLAAESHVDRSIDGPEAFVQTNVVGSFRLLSEATAYWRSLPIGEKEAFRFLHVSTDEVYGSLPGTGRFSEESPYDPRSPYAASKAASDHLGSAWFHTYGLPVIITNSSNNYGPFQFPEKLIPLVIQRALTGQPIPVYGNGQQVRDWLFVNDHADALIAALERGVPGRTYNVGANSERRNIDVVCAICDILDELAPDASMKSRRTLISHVEDRPGHDVRYALDASRIERELGWRASVDFDTGLRKTVAWYLDNTVWLERVLAGTYRGERLGLPSAPATAQ